MRSNLWSWSRPCSWVKWSSATSACERFRKMLVKDSSETPWHRALPESGSCSCSTRCLGPLRNIGPVWFAELRRRLQFESVFLSGGTGCSGEEKAIPSGTNAESTDGFAGVVGGTSQTALVVAALKVRVICRKQGGQTQSPTFLIVSRGLFHLLDFPPASQIGHLPPPRSHFLMQLVPSPGPSPAGQLGKPLPCSWTMGRADVTSEFGKSCRRERVAHL